MARQPIPCGILLSTTDTGWPQSALLHTRLHSGLGLDDRGWYRCDARGNSKPGIHCAFTPGQENLAYPAIYNGEQTYLGVWAEPWPDLIAAMEKLQCMTQYRSHPIDACPPATDLCVSEATAPNIE